MKNCGECSSELLTDSQARPVESSNLQLLTAKPDKLATDVMTSLPKGWMGPACGGHAGSGRSVRMGDERVEWVPASPRLASIQQDPNFLVASPSGVRTSDGVVQAPDLDSRPDGRPSFHNFLIVDSGLPYGMVRCPAAVGRLSPVNWHYQ